MSCEAPPNSEHEKCGHMIMVVGIVDINAQGRTRFLISPKVVEGAILLRGV